MDDTDTREDEFIVNNPNDINPLYAMKQNQELPDDVSDETPFSDPDDIETEIDPTNQIFDPASDIDSQDEYDAGPDIASGAAPTRQ